MKIKKVNAAGAVALALTTVLLPASANAHEGTSIGYTPIDAVSEHVARVTAEELVAAEAEIWRTGDLATAKSLALRTLDSRLSTTLSPEAVAKVLERAAMLRKTVTDSGFEITRYSASEDYRWSRVRAGPLLR